ncbi:MAG TPA: MFS transporter, partial [Vulgatibacter sp.]
GVVLLAMPIAPTVPVLAVLGVGLGVASATVSAMVFGLLATEVPADRRSATLNLVYLPLYAAGVLGPASGALVATVAGLPGPFILGGVVYLLGAAVIVLRRAPRPVAPPIAQVAQVEEPSPDG